MNVGYEPGSGCGFSGGGGRVWGRFLLFKTVETPFWTLWCSELGSTELGLGLARHLKHSSPGVGLAAQPTLVFVDDMLEKVAPRLGLMTLDETLMKAVLELAAQSVRDGKRPFAAAIAVGNRILRTEADKPDSPLDHPEIALLRLEVASRRPLSGLTLVANVEPCPMCAGAIYYSGISRLVYSVSRDKFYDHRDAIRGNNNRKYRSCLPIVTDGTREVEVVGGVLESEGELVISGFDFSKRSRQEPIE